MVQKKSHQAPDTGSPDTGLSGNKSPSLSLTIPAMSRSQTASSVTWDMEGTTQVLPQRSVSNPVNHATTPARAQSNGEDAFDDGATRGEHADVDAKLQMNEDELNERESAVRMEIPQASSAGEDEMLATRDEGHSAKNQGSATTQTQEQQVTNAGIYLPFSEKQLEQIALVHGQQLLPLPPQPLKPPKPHPLQPIVPNQSQPLLQSQSHQLGHPSIGSKVPSLGVPGGPVPRPGVMGMGSVTARPEQQQPRPTASQPTQAQVPRQQPPVSHAAQAQSQQQPPSQSRPPSQSQPQPPQLTKTPSQSQTEVQTQSQPQPKTQLQPHSPRHAPQPIHSQTQPQTQPREKPQPQVHSPIRPSPFEAEDAQDRPSSPSGEPVRSRRRGQGASAQEAQPPAQPVRRASLRRARSDGDDDAEDEDNEETLNPLQLDDSDSDFEVRPKKRIQRKFAQLQQQHQQEQRKTTQTKSSLRPRNDLTEEFDEFSARIASFEGMQSLLRSGSDDTMADGPTWRDLLLPGSDAISQLQFAAVLPPATGAHAFKRSLDSPHETAYGVAHDGGGHLGAGMSVAGALTFSPSVYGSNSNASPSSVTLRQLRPLMPSSSGHVHHLDLSNGTGIVVEEITLLHSDRSNEGEEAHLESPSRVLKCLQTLKQEGLLDRLIRIRGRMATFDEIARVHKQSFLENLKLWSNLSDHELAAEAESLDSLYLNKYSVVAAQTAAGGTIELIDAIVKGKVRNGLALIRPPGHHADSLHSQGFCVVNNVAIATAHALQVLSVNKILIVDWDIHFGNGTEAIFHDDPRVVCFSVHRDDNGRFYPALKTAQSAKNVGRDGTTINVAWPRGGMTDGDYISAFLSILLPVAYEFAPELVIVAAGFDAAEGDPLGECNVTPVGFSHLLYHLLGLAQGKVAVVLEGGYHVPAVSQCVQKCTEILLGAPPRPLPGVSPSTFCVRALRSTIHAQMKNWKCFRLAEALEAAAPRRDDELMGRDDELEEDSDADAIAQAMKALQAIKTMRLASQGKIETLIEDLRKMKSRQDMGLLTTSSNSRPSRGSGRGEREEEQDEKNGEEDGSDTEEEEEDDEEPTHVASKRGRRPSVRKVETHRNKSPQPRGSTKPTEMKPVEHIRKTRLLRGRRAFTPSEVESVSSSEMSSSESESSDAVDESEASEYSDENDTTKGKKLQPKVTPPTKGRPGRPPKAPAAAEKPNGVTKSVQTGAASPSSIVTKPKSIPASHAPSEPSSTPSPNTSPSPILVLSDSPAHTPLPGASSVTPPAPESQAPPKPSVPTYVYTPASALSRLQGSQLSQAQGQTQGQLQARAQAQAQAQPHGQPATLPKRRGRPPKIRPEQMTALAQKADSGAKMTTEPSTDGDKEGIVNERVRENAAADARPPSETPGVAVPATSVVSTNPAVSTKPATTTADVADVRETPPKGSLSTSSEADEPGKVFGSNSQAQPNPAIPSETSSGVVIPKRRGRPPGKKSATSLQPNVLVPQEGKPQQIPQEGKMQQAHQQQPERQSQPLPQNEQGEEQTAEEKEQVVLSKLDMECIEEAMRDLISPDERPVSVDLEHEAGVDASEKEMTLSTTISHDTGLRAGINTNMSEGVNRAAMASMGHAESGITTFDEVESLAPFSPQMGSRESSQEGMSTGASAGELEVQSDGTVLGVKRPVTERRPSIDKKPVFLEKRADKRNSIDSIRPVLDEIRKRIKRSNPNT